PPFMNRWMTCLAFGGKCATFGASGFVLAAEGAAFSSSASSPARPSTPRPVPVRWSNSRRETPNSARISGPLGIFAFGFVEFVQEHFGVEQRLLEVLQVLGVGEI